MNTAHFKAELEKEREGLESTLAGLGTQNPHNPSDWDAGKPVGEEFGADLSDNADVIADQHENNASVNELEIRLRLINHALAKFDAGTYGVCEVSGDMIEEARLSANPAARTSIAHMDKEATLTI